MKSLKRPPKQPSLSHFDNLFGHIRWLQELGQPARFLTQLTPAAAILHREVRHKMQQPTTALHASALDDAIGIGCFLSDTDGVHTVGHGGSAIGQFTELLMVPERGFALVALSNASPNGIPFNQAVVRWALQTFVGVVDRDRQSIAYNPTRAREIVGNYANDAMTLAIGTTGATLALETGLKPESRAALDADPGPDYAPFDVGLLPGDGNEYIIASGGLKGQRGFFTRDTSGAVIGVDLAGRLIVPGCGTPPELLASLLPGSSGANGSARLAVRARNTCPTNVWANLYCPGDRWAWSSQFVSLSGLSALSHVSEIRLPSAYYLPLRLPAVAVSFHYRMVEQRLVGFPPSVAQVPFDCTTVRPPITPHAWRDLGGQGGRAGAERLGL